MKTITIPEKPHGAIIHIMCLRAHPNYGHTMQKEEREELEHKMEELYNEIVNFYRDRNLLTLLTPLPWLTRLFSMPKLSKNNG